MTKRQNFIDMVENLIKSAPEDISESFKEGLSFFEGFKCILEKPKPIFTENGLKIISYMRENKETKENLFKASDIAEGLFISSRSVSGSIRKLVTDGYVTKVGESPILYTLTPLGDEVLLTNNNN